MQPANDDLAYASWEADPDAELFGAWTEWLAVARALNVLSDDAPDEERERLGQALYEAERAIEGLPAHTVRGVATKLKVALAAVDESDETQRLVADGREPLELVEMDIGVRLLWGLARDLERIGALSSVA